MDLVCIKVTELWLFPDRGWCAYSLSHTVHFQVASAASVSIGPGPAKSVYEFM